MRHSSVKKMLFSAIVSLFPIIAQGQFVVNGGVSPRTKWMQAQGETHNVIYPEGADSLAMRYLWLLEQNSSAVMLGLGGIKPASIPVVLYNHTVNSNGMVVWAPKRMELFTLPMQSGIYSTKWEDQLVLHESRHVGQIAYFTKGIFKVGSYIFGEQAPSVGVGVYPSRWFLEGDAVVAETELTNSGRGRSAEFMEFYRASFLEGEKREWDRWKLDSYKYYTPNRYAFGYLIGSTVRYKSGKYDYAGEMLNNLVHNFYTPYARSKSYREAVGGTPREFFRQGVEMMTEQWQQEMLQRGQLTSPEQLLAKRGRSFSEYLSPVKVGNDSIVYIRHSYDAPSCLVLVAGGREKVLKVIPSNVTSVKGCGRKLWFTQMVPDFRWENQVYGDVFSYDLENGNFERLTRKGYYAHVVPQENGEVLQAVAYSPEGGTSVEFLDAADGKVIERFPAPYNGDLRSTACLNGKIYALCVTGRGMGLFSLEEDGGWMPEIYEQSADIEELGSNGKQLYFLSDMDGVRNVYTYSPQNGAMVRVTNAKYGASAPIVSDGKVYYSDLQTNGRWPVVADAGQAAGCGSGFSPRLADGKIEGAYRYVVADELTRQVREALGKEGLLADEKEIQERNGTSIVKYKVPYGEFAEGIRPEKYSKMKHLVHIHSWAPFYYNADKIMSSDYDNLYDVLSPGATLYSQNTLGTAVAMLGYSYRNGRNEGHFSLAYRGWYPVLEFTADVNEGYRTLYRLALDDDYNFTIKTQSLNQPSVDFRAKAYLPINLTKNGWSRAVVPMVQWEHSNLSFYSLLTKRYHKLNAVTAAVRYYREREKARSGVYPKFGYGGLLSWRGMIGLQENYGSQAAVDLYGYLPGFAPTHGIKVSFEAQRQFNDDKILYIDNLANMPRGYTDDVFGDKYVKGGIDYAFPVYLGDKNLFKLAYLKRMRVIPFADYAVNTVSGTSSVKKVGMYSYGSDILVDFAPLAIDWEVSLGVRYARNGNDGGVNVPADTWQVFFSTNLF